MPHLNYPVSRRSFLAGTAASGALIMLHPFSARAQANQAHLRIMETTDIHVNVLPYDYYADKANDTMGLSRTASLIAAVRKEATNAMLIDNGDLLQGNPMGDYIAYEKGLKEGDLHPIMKGMNLLGYECSTLGNHEFNYGLSFLDKVLAGANFPFVCANLIRGTELAANPRDDELYLKPYVILDKKIKDGSGVEQPIKIGIIGFVPPQIMVWDLKNLEGNVRTRDIVEAARAWVPQIKEEGADISSRSRIPASISSRATAWRTPPSSSPASKASMRCSPAISIWSSPARRIFRRSMASTPRKARCRASPP